MLFSRLHSKHGTQRRFLLTGVSSEVAHKNTFRPLENLSSYFFVERISDGSTFEVENALIESISFRVGERRPIAGMLITPSQYHVTF